jgi:hypothetical protein
VERRAVPFGLGAPYRPSPCFKGRRGLVFSIVRSGQSSLKLKMLTVEARHPIARAVVRTLASSILLFGFTDTASNSGWRRRRALQKTRMSSAPGVTPLAPAFSEPARGCVRAGPIQLTPIHRHDRGGYGDERQLRTTHKRRAHRDRANAWLGAKRENDRALRPAQRWH